MKLLNNIFNVFGFCMAFEGRLNEAKAPQRV